ncbi:MAG: DNA gyrase C-terminal beta-propeller domain-containing protein, partial [Solirubrobacteraceae bacterium]
VLMVSRAGQAVRFHESDVRSMGRDTTGVAGMNVSDPDNWVLSMDVARADQDLLVITDSGFGKRTGIDQFRKTKRGAMGVRAIKAAQHKGKLAGALVVREHEELVFISEAGMVVRQSVRGISRQGRDATGVRVVNIREDDRVSAVALVVEGDEPVVPPAAPPDLPPEPEPGDHPAP